MLSSAAAAEPATQPVQQQKAETPKLTMLELAMKGGPFMVPLAICSLAGVAVIIERLIALRKPRVVPPGFVGGLKIAFPEGSADREAGLAYCRTQDSPAARVIAAGINKLHRGEEAVEQAIEDAGANEVSKLSRNLRFLYGIAAVSPMIGLLGTVSGMITAFQVTSVVVGPEKSLQLAKGIYEALVTTYAGLCIAVPTLIAYYYFQGKIDRLISEMNDVSMEVVHHYVTAPAATEPALASQEV